LSGRFAVVAAALITANLASAQSPAVTYGVTGGAVRFNSQHSARVFSGTLQYQPKDWLSFDVTPAYLTAQFDSVGVTYTSTGIGDLPVSGSVSKSFDDAFWSPDLGLGLELTLPTGNTACGLGSGSAGLGLDLGAGFSPVDPLHLYINASRSLSGLSTASSLDAPEATSLSLEASYQITPKWSAGLSFGGDFGHTDSSQALARNIGGGTSFNIKGPLALSLGASAGLTSGSARWALSIGLGTAFAGTNPVNPDTPARILKHAFAGSGGVGRGNGQGHVGGSKQATSTTCS
jgi:hypothetical protein